jgi:hypothetical protein
VPVPLVDEPLVDEPEVPEPYVEPAPPDPVPVLVSEPWVLVAPEALVPLEDFFCVWCLRWVDLLGVLLVEPDVPVAFVPVVDWLAPMLESVPEVDPAPPTSDDEEPLGLVVSEP